MAIRLYLEGQLVNPYLVDLADVARGEANVEFEPIQELKLFPPASSGEEIAGGAQPALGPAQPPSEIELHLL